MVPENFSNTHSQPFRNILRPKVVTNDLDTPHNTIKSNNTPEILNFSIFKQQNHHNLNNLDNGTWKLF